MFCFRRYLLGIMVGLLAIPLWAAQGETLPERVVLQLKWFHQFQFAGYYAAKEKGYYAAAGLDVEIRPLDPAKSVVTQVVNGQADYAVGDSTLVADYANGEPLKALAAIMQHDPLVFVARGDSGILSPHGMRGKRVMFDAAAGAPLRALLKQAGLSEGDYTHVPSRFGNEDFVRGRVDVMSFYLSDQVALLGSQGLDLNVINPISYGLDFYSDILFTTQDELINNPERVERFLRASLKGWQYALDHADEIATLIIDQYNPKVSRDQLLREADEIRKLALLKGVPLGQMDPAKLKRIADIYASLGLARTVSEAQLSAFVYSGTEKLELTDAESAWLKRHPLIRVGIDRGFAPFEWVDEVGRYRGVTQDYLAILEKILGVKFEVATDKSWQETLDMAKRGELDMLTDANRTPERETFLYFTDPYLESPVVIINHVNQGFVGNLQGLIGKKLAIVSGYFAQENLRREFPRVQQVPVKSETEAFDMLRSGSAAAYVGDGISLNYIIQDARLTDLRYSGETPYKSYHSMAVIHANAELLTILQKAIRSIPASERQRILGKWLNLRIEHGISTKVLLGYTAGMMAVLAAFLLWIWQLHRSRKALYESEERWRFALEGSNQGLWDWNVQTDKVYFSSHLIYMLGYNAREFGDDARAWSKRIHPDDLESCMADIQRHIAGKSLIYENTHRMLTKSGDYKWMLGRGKVMSFSASGSPLRMIATETDVTRAMEAESNLRLASLVFEHAQEAIVVTDAQDYIISVNPAFCQITGYDVDEVIGKPSTVLRSEAQEVDVYQSITEGLRSRGKWQGEVTGRTRNGKGFVQWLTITCVFDDIGRVSQHVSMFFDITERKEREEIIWEHAHFDALTGLPNRRLFSELLHQETRRAHREEKSLWLLFLDLDRFKEVNDSLGHGIGDRLLIEVAERVRSSLREIDTVARLGGDEFLIMLNDVEDPKHIDRICEKLILAIGRPYNLNGEEVFVTASIGVTCYPDDAEESEDLLKNADQAMYAAKRAGRNRHAYITPELQQAAKMRARISSDLRHALADGQFEVHYQPIVDLSNGRVTKAEALLRWNHPEHGYLSPASFIPIAEECGAIHEIGAWVFDEALIQLLQWQADYGIEMQMSVNLSPVQFSNASNQQQNWVARVSELGVTPSSVVVEITEGTLIDHLDLVTARLYEFRDAGIQVAIDDFGTGYSSLAYLNQFDIDFLKIDRSFSRKLAPDSSELALSEAIVAMAHKLGLKVIAEGIETEQQRALLTACGCDYGQGYLFSRPVPAQQFEQYLQISVLLRAVSHGR